MLAKVIKPEPAFILNLLSWLPLSIANDRLDPASSSVAVTVNTFVPIAAYSSISVNPPYTTGALSLISVISLKS